MAKITIKSDKLTSLNRILPMMNDFDRLLVVTAMKKHTVCTNSGKVYEFNIWA
ncbi:MAG: hypothetical protein LUD00_08985 [Prevotellaceae bacterium]|nr:hypothetical protein [Prevotellaceae bacterium]